MNIDGNGSSVVNWRTLDLKEDIHYCDENESVDSSEPNNVYKKNGKWFFETKRLIHTGAMTYEQWKENDENRHTTEISFCPYCGVNLNELRDEDEH